MDTSFEPSFLQKIQLLNLNMDKKNQIINRLKKNIAIQDADNKSKCDEIMQLKLKLKQMGNKISNQHSQLQNVKHKHHLESQQFIS